MSRTRRGCTEDVESAAQRRPFRADDLILQSATGQPLRAWATIGESDIVVAKVGAALILSGEHEKLAYARPVHGIFYVVGLDGFEAGLLEHGAEILHGPRNVTGGRNLTARHPDGLVIEYFEARR